MSTVVNGGPPKNRRLSLALFLVLVIGGGVLIGYLTPPDDWYARLDKPPFNPPGAVFGPVWTVLYALIAVAGWRTWQRSFSGRPMKLWWTQLVLNFAWPPIFFGAHRITVALGAIILLLVVVVAFIAASWRQDRAAAWLFAPYLAWVAFATVLNASIAVLN